MTEQLLIGKNFRAGCSGELPPNALESSCGAQTVRSSQLLNARTVAETTEDGEHELFLSKRVVLVWSGKFSKLTAPTIPAARLATVLRSGPDWSFNNLRNSIRFFFCFY